MITPPPLARLSLCSHSRLLRQDYPDHEVIVVNDGSDDGTLSALIHAFQLQIRSHAPSAHAAIRAIYASDTRDLTSWIRRMAERATR